MVTHDRHLMNSLACPILYLEDGKATLYPSYDALMGRSDPAPVVEKSSEPAKLGYGKEQRRRRAELRAKIKACEDEMEACGAREVELDNEINSPEVYNDPQLLREKSDELCGSAVPSGGAVCRLGSCHGRAGTVRAECRQERTNDGRRNVPMNPKRRQTKRMRSPFPACCLPWPWPSLLWRARWSSPG